MTPDDRLADLVDRVLDGETVRGLNKAEALKVCRSAKHDTPATARRDRERDDGTWLVELVDPNPWGEV